MEGKKKLQQMKLFPMFVVNYSVLTYFKMYLWNVSV